MGALLDLRGALELRRELLHAAGGVDETLLAGVGGMRVHRDVAHDDEVVLAVDLLGAGRLHRGLGQEFLACSDVEEADVVESGMAFGLHGKGRVESALARLVTRLDFVDDVDLALAADDLAGRVAQFGGFNGGNDFHKGPKKRVARGRVKGKDLVSESHVLQRRSLTTDAEKPRP